MTEMSKGAEERAKKCGAEGTWDIPFNPARAVNISSKEFLKALNPDAGITNNEAEGVEDSRCEDCVIVDCGKDCKRRGKTLEDASDLREGDAPAVPDDTRRVVTGCVKDIGNNGGEGGCDGGTSLGVRDEVPGKLAKAMSPVNDALVKLNQKLASGRGRSVRRAVVVEPGRPSNQESVKSGQGKTVEELGSAFEAIAIKDGVDVKGVDSVAKVLREEDSIGDVLGRFAPQKNFECVNGKEVWVTHVYSHNLVHVVEVEVMKNEYLDLLDDVNDVCKDEPNLVKEPEVGDLVCAPHNNGVMHRAVVQSKHEDGRLVVRFIDLGGNKVLSLHELKSFSEDLFQVPLLGYDVHIRDIEDELPLLSPEDFENDLVPWLMKQKLKITESKIIGGRLHEAAFTGKGYSLPDKIRRFQIWEWERLLETGLKNDDTIFAGKDWDYKKALVLPTTLFPKRPVMMEYSRVLGGCVMTFKNIQLDSAKKYTTVLGKQIDHYITKVQASNHYPTIRETFLFRPDRSYWRRATRLDIDCIYCFDTDELFPLKSKNETRRMCPDFLKIPVLSIMCRFSGVENDDRLQAAIEKTFKRGQSYPITILQYDDEAELYDIIPDAYQHLLS